MAVTRSTTHQVAPPASPNIRVNVGADSSIESAPPREWGACENAGEGSRSDGRVTPTRR